MPYRFLDSYKVNLKRMCEALERSEVWWMKELLFSVTKKDLEITFFSGTGPGGQNRNKVQNCVRMRHPESGASSTGQSNRDRQANLREAFKGLINSPLFKVWHSKKTQEMLTGKTIEQRVEEQMDERNMKVEARVDGKWVEFIE